VLRNSNAARLNVRERRSPAPEGWANPGRVQLHIRCMELSKLLNSWRSRYFTGGAAKFATERAGDDFEALGHLAEIVVERASLEKLGRADPAASGAPQVLYPTGHGHHRMVAQLA
jgi:hypothetical protein